MHAKVNVFKVLNDGPVSVFGLTGAPFLGKLSIQIFDFLLPKKTLCLTKFF